MNSEVIFVIHTLKIGGAERQVAGLANYLAEQGVDVSIVLLDNAIIKFQLNEKVQVICTNRGVKEVPANNKASCSLFAASEEKRLSVWEKLNLKADKAFRPKQFEIESEAVYLEKNYAAPLRQFLSKHPHATVVSRMLVPNIASMMALQNLNNRLIIMDSSSPEYGLPSDHPQLMLRKKYISRVDMAVFQTPDVQEYYSWLPELRKKVIPNYLKSGELPTAYQGVRRKEVVNFCHLLPVKNLTLLIDAFEMFHQSFPDYSLGIYGEGEERQRLTQYIQDKGMSDCVTLYGEDIRVHQKIRDAAMFVSSSDREGISNSMLEAMAIGLPTICTDCPAGGARMMIQYGINGLLVPMRDPVALFEAMKAVASDQTLAERLSLNGAKIREELTIEKIGRQWMDVIEEVKR